MKNIMKKVADNKVADVFEIKVSNEDIIDITLIENAKILHKETNKEYFNGTFLKIVNRKGDTRVLDLISHIDITNMLEELEIIYNKKTKEKPIFCGC